VKNSSKALYSGDEKICERVFGCHVTSDRTISAMKSADTDTSVSPVSTQFKMSKMLDAFLLMEAGSLLAGGRKTQHWHNSRHSLYFSSSGLFHQRCKNTYQVYFQHFCRFSRILKLILNRMIRFAGSYIDAHLGLKFLLILIQISIN